LYVVSAEGDVAALTEEIVKSMGSMGCDVVLEASRKVVDYRPRTYVYCLDLSVH
jgi:tRNA G37 N-methylase Trm5